MTKISKNSVRKAFQKRRLNSKTIAQLETFFESIPPHEFRDTLIELYHSYIRHEHEALPYNFRQLSESIDVFLDLLKDVDGV